MFKVRGKLTVVWASETTGRGLVPRVLPLQFEAETLELAYEGLNNRAFKGINKCLKASFSGSIHEMKGMQTKESDWLTLRDMEILK